LIQIPEQKILDVIKLEKGSLVMVTKGVNTGQTGLVTDVSKSTFTLPKRIKLTIDKKEFEIPTDLVIVIGKETPVIQIR
jgi:small subunit ribosomal protein S4e